jgi:thioredoxin reductase (NADPH)
MDVCIQSSANRGFGTRNINFEPSFEETPVVIETDALIIGAGPVGLFQVFELGLLEIKAHIIDSLASVGGQCVELYSDKPIYDIPAIPICTGRELIENLIRQITPFQPTFHLSQEVVHVSRRENGYFDVSTSKGTTFLAKTIFIAAGVGAFQPRRIKVVGIDQFEGSQLFYSVKNREDFSKKNIVICGGGDSALDWALSLVRLSESVILVHRREEFRASPSSVSKMKELLDRDEMQFLIGQIVGFEQDKNSHLKEIKILGADGVTRRLTLDYLLVFFGLSPKLGPITSWGLDIDRKQLCVDTEKFETNIPRIFAVGDINTYPGKKKLILSGFHEAALAAFGAAKYIFPEKIIHMQYTTTSPKLHKILGVDSPIFE